jgi:hypothetical protein
MQLNIESFDGKPGVYFITDSTHTHVRIGESINAGGRLLDHISSRGKANTILLYFLECENTLEEERRAHTYFMKYKIEDDTNSFYNSKIIPMLEEYVTESGLRIIQSGETLKTRARSDMSDLYGKKVNLNENRPRCHFFPDQVAQIMGKAGTGETYRTYLYKGRRVLVSGKFHNLMMEFKKEMRGISTGASLNQFIYDEEENRIETFLV